MRVTAMEGTVKLSVICAYYRIVNLCTMLARQTVESAHIRDLAPDLTLH